MQQSILSQAQSNGVGKLREMETKEGMETCFFEEGSLFTKCPNCIF